MIGSTLAKLDNVVIPTTSHLFQSVTLALRGCRTTTRATPSSMESVSSEREQQPADDQYNADLMTQCPSTMLSRQLINQSLLADKSLGQTPRRGFRRLTGDNSNAKQVALLVILQPPVLAQEEKHHLPSLQETEAVRWKSAADPEDEALILLLVIGERGKAADRTQQIPQIGQTST